LRRSALAGTIDTISMISTSRVHWWTTLALSSAVVLMLAVFLGPRQSLPVQPRPAGEENVLRVAYMQPLQIDPHRRTFPFPVQNQFILSLWEPLIECDPETGQPQPAAAEGWIWSEDRLTLTLKLRRDGRWSNGDPVTARDFVRGWQRLLLQDMDVAGVLFPLKNASAFHEGKASAAELGVQAVDDFTLRLTLAGIRSTLVTELADPLLSPLHQSTESVLQEKKFLRQPGSLVTNGAFCLEQAGGEGFKLRRSAEYRDRAGTKLAGVHFLRVDTLKMALLLVAAGKIDMMGPVPEGRLAALPSERETAEATETALVVSTLDLNTTRGPLRDLRVRRALALAMDRGAAIRAAEPNLMVPAFAWVPDMPGRPAIKILSENPAEARRLLAEAGYPGGRDFPVLVMPVSPSWRAYTYLQDWTDRWYRELGIRTYMAVESDARRMEGLKTGDYDIVYNGLIATVPDAGDMLGAFAMPGYNATRWEDPEVARLLSEADRKTGAERLVLLEQIERRVMAAVPTIPMMFEHRRTLLAKEVNGWYADPLGRQSLKRLSIQLTPTKSSPRRPYD
jgi:oligopeptide transport system substrate-binding protein